MKHAPLVCGLAAVGLWLSGGYADLAAQAQELSEPSTELVAEEPAGRQQMPVVITDSLQAWYLKTYPFMSMDDTLFTFETEFRFPEGYYRPEASSLTPFAEWVSHLPLWHKYKPVGIWKGGKAFERDEISRVVHIPWLGPVYTDVGFPLRFAAEFCRWTQREYDWRVGLKGNSDTLDYATWLTCKVAFTPLGDAKVKPAVARDSSSLEFYRFLNMVMKHQTYASLAANCDPVSPEEAMPGDLLIGHTEGGDAGRVYVILVALTNEAGDRLYTVGTGCAEPDACDFHIPLLTLDRSFPWVSQGQMEALVDDLPRWGYFRLRVPQGR